MSRKRTFAEDEAVFRARYADCKTLEDVVKRSCISSRGKKVYDDVNGAEAFTAKGCEALRKNGHYQRGSSK